MTVPFCDLTRLARRIAPIVASDWSACASSADFIEGPRVAALEEQLAAELGVPHMVCCGNGTDALVLGLMALGVRAGDTIALPALTFFATYEAVRAVGATPLLIDADPNDLQLSLSDFIAAHAAHSFRFAITAHLFGWASGDIARLRQYCDVHGVALLEDGAQSYGVEVDGESVYSGADIGTLSFYPAKVIGGCGDGGAVTCQTAARAATIRSLRNHGRSAHYGHERVGMNSRMGALGAAYLSRIVAMADDIIDARCLALCWYGRELEECAGLRLWGAPSNVRGNGYLLVATSDRWDGATIEACLKDRGIGCARTYPTTVADQVGARGAATWGELPVARTFCKRVINLPVFYGITEREVNAAAAALREILK